MINTISNAASGLRNGVDRFAERPESITQSPQAPPEEDERSVPPLEENPSARESHTRHSDKSDEEFRSVSEAPRTSDIAREMADRIQAETDAKADIAVIRASDETVGTLLDIHA